MLIVTVILGLLLIAAAVAWFREHENKAALRAENASLSEAVSRLEAERATVQSEKPHLGALTASIGELGSSLARMEESEAKRHELVAEMNGNVARGNERIDALVGRWSNPKQRSQLGEAWLVGALRRLGLSEGLHFEIQKASQHRRSAGYTRRRDRRPPAAA